MAVFLTKSAFLVSIFTNLVKFSDMVAYAPVLRFALFLVFLRFFISIKELRNKSLPPCSSVQFLILFLWKYLVNIPQSRNSFNIWHVSITLGGKMAKCPECGAKLVDVGSSLICPNDLCDYSPTSQSRKLMAESIGFDDGINLSVLAVPWANGSCRRMVIIRYNG